MFRFNAITIIILAGFICKNVVDFERYVAMQKHLKHLRHSSRRTNWMI